MQEEKQDKGDFQGCYLKVVGGVIGKLGKLFWYMLCIEIETLFSSDLGKNAIQMR